MRRLGCGINVRSVSCDRGTGLGTWDDLGASGPLDSSSRPQISHREVLSHLARVLQAPRGHRIGAHQLGPRVRPGHMATLTRPESRLPSAAIRLKRESLRVCSLPI